MLSAATIRGWQCAFHGHVAHSPTETGSTIGSPAAAAANTSSRGISTPQADSPGFELDMRGWRAEEVASALDKYLDRAYLAGLPWVHLIHGKGMGVLRQVVRQFLEGHPLVASVRSGEQGEGGDGVTVVHLHKHRE